MSNPDHVPSGALSAEASQAMKTIRPEDMGEYARFYYESGRKQGRADLLALLLAHRYGPLPEGVAAELEEASDARVEAVGKRMLAADNLEDALDWRWRPIS